MNDTKTYPSTGKKFLITLAICCCLVFLGSLVFMGKGQLVHGALVASGVLAPFMLMFFLLSLWADATVVLSDSRIEIRRYFGFCQREIRADQILQVSVIPTLLTWPCLSKRLVVSYEDRAICIESIGIDGFDDLVDSLRALQQIENKTIQEDPD